jgi:hypothetical protein
MILNGLVEIFSFDKQNGIFSNSYDGVDNHGIKELQNNISLRKKNWPKNFTGLVLEKCLYLLTVIIF